MPSDEQGLQHGMEALISIRQTLTQVLLVGSTASVNSDMSPHDLGQQNISCFVVEKKGMSEPLGAFMRLLERLVICMPENPNVK